MGVPALFRWLSKKYPKIIQSVEEEEPCRVPGPDGEMVEIPVDTSRPNPNGEEYDCLYLDMNGIVHPCTHPEGRPAPETEEEMLTEVFKYTERVISMIRPRKLLMMAIDGVAPRAKMNQQRSRRFRSAQDAKIQHSQLEVELEERKKRGEAGAEDVVKMMWDSNAITPGTPFMDKLAGALRYWIVHKLNTDPGWKNLSVVLSDASVPGEGEHKIMDYIRRKRSDPAHDPNMQHVIYGLDADLIMLSLATHEPYFKVLREDVFAQDKGKGCHCCGEEGHFSANCNNKRKPKDEAKKGGKKPFIFLDVPTLREYLEIELQVPSTSFAFDLERAIDDWVFLIFFVGNDFLPHLPSLEIREGAIDTLLQIWKRELPRMRGYVTNNGKVELENAQLILDGLAKEENDIFLRRKETEERQDANAKRRKRQQEEMQHGNTQYVPVEVRKPGPPPAPPEVKPSANVKKGPIMLDGDSMDVVRNRAQIRMANISAADALRAELNAGKGSKAKGTKRAASQVDDVSLKREKRDASHEDEDGNEDKEEVGAVKDPLLKDEGASIKDEDPSMKGEDFPIKDEDLADETIDDDASGAHLQRTVNKDGTVEYEDTVKLWEPGYRERYYRQKFQVELSDTAFRREVVKKYVEGLCWVLAYYYQGCPSWKWYYPYHYSPFAADFTDMADLTIDFDNGTPFRPFEQLMGVLPAESRKNLPDPFQWLMTNGESEIADFYPSEFAIDMNGKKMAWQGVALLPFIDEQRLLDALQKRYKDLTEDETRRNSFGRSLLFVDEDSELYAPLSRLYAKRTDGLQEPIDTNKTSRIAGLVEADPACVPGSTFHSPLASQGMQDIHNDRCISVLFDMPPQRVPHRSVLLRGVRMPRKRLNQYDADYVRHGRRGGPPRGGRGGRFGAGRDNGSNGQGPYGRYGDRQAWHGDGSHARRSAPYATGANAAGFATGANATGPYGGGYDAAYSGYGGYNAGAGAGYGGGYGGGYGADAGAGSGAGYGAYNGASAGYGAYGGAGASASAGYGAYGGAGASAGYTSGGGAGYGAYGAGAGYGAYAANPYATYTGAQPYAANSYGAPSYGGGIGGGPYGAGPYAGYQTHDPSRARPRPGRGGGPYGSS
ncbi:5'-3' exoribonuclease 2 [Malassezia vespertilionis]|uniref:5'-3' exoribonuclease 2 n=1 Tax=Malassezia vespertilionis TaxID=2020962 RepID=UPI0024B1C925|nr:5'-3' exoribonuclease 2 [Malassezia vespertilionis]WFD06766.1 5'-3' exoribonuclease 2 [Malassezia vespertilionis]